MTSQAPLPQATINTCRLLGIDPPRLLVPSDIKKAYPNMPLVQASVWQQVRTAQETQR